MRKRFRHRKIIEWHCPKCGNIFSSMSQTFILPMENHPRCKECQSKLVRRSFDELRK